MLDIKKDILWRVYLCFIAIAILGFMVLGRVAQLQFVQGQHWRDMGDSMRLSKENLDAQRGTIFSEAGEMLSTSIPQFDVRVDFRPDALRAKSGKLFYNNLDSLTYLLSKLFGDKSKNEYRQDLVRAYKKREPYYLLRSKISFEEWRQMRQFPLVRLHQYKSGFRFEEKDNRYNPFGLLANRTIGLSRGDIKSSVGLEKYYDSVLRGQSGERMVRYIAGGTRIPVDGSEVEPVNGRDIFTTLDVQMQDVAESALMDMMVQQEAIQGCAVVMEVATGKVKAIANLGKMPGGGYYENNNYALMPSEPGSTIKLVTLLAALEDKYVNLNNTVEINGGVWQLNERTIRDAERSPKNLLTYKEAFEHSSNVAMSKLAYYNYNKNPGRFIQHYKNLHLDRKTGIDLQDPYKPVVKDPKSTGWHNVQTLASMGFGYEVTLSPLHLLMVYNAIANNGKMMKPYLVNAIRTADGSMRNIAPVVLNEKICSRETLAQLQECLEAVCTQGTARKAFDSCWYAVAGKTGTTKVDDREFDYNDGVYQSSFAGYFPAKNPRYSCIVVIKNKPGASPYTGGSVAAPVFKNISDRLMVMVRGNRSATPFAVSKDTLKNYYHAASKDAHLIFNQLGVNCKTTGDGHWSRVLQYSGRLAAANENKTKGVIPDVRGMGLRDALDCLENKGLKVTVRGKGKVAAQSLPPGTAIQKNTTVFIDLN